MCVESLLWRDGETSELEHAVCMQSECAVCGVCGVQCAACVVCSVPCAMCMGVQWVGVQWVGCAVHGWAPACRHDVWMWQACDSQWLQCVLAVRMVSSV